MKGKITGALLVLVVIVVMAIAVFHSQITGMMRPLNSGNGPEQATGASPGAASSKGDKKVLYWQDPMNPGMKSTKPGKSADGMDLLPVYADESSAGAKMRLQAVMFGLDSQYSAGAVSTGGTCTRIRS